MATSVKLPHEIQPVIEVNLQSIKWNFEALVKSSSYTLKRNPKMELSKPDLIKLLSYLEGELQARDIVIATLKCEKMKYMIKYGTPRTSSLADPVAALCRDNFAAQTGMSDPLADTEQQLNPLETLVSQQRKTLVHMAKIFQEVERRHRHIITDLMERSKNKETSMHEQSLNGLEDNPLMKQDFIHSAEKRLEDDLKISGVPDEEKLKQKQIVLLLLAERKKIVMKYIEERKRSEDLAQILSEEKSRVDSMAEGLEEESKKSLQMEAELEKQLAEFDAESQVLRTNLIIEEKRVRDLEAELEKVRGEAALMEKQLLEMQQMAGQTNTMIPNRTASQGATLASHSNSTVVSSVAKVVQPTATVSSVPVAGPTTGVARCVPASQGVRGIAYAPPVQTLKGEKRPFVPSTIPVKAPQPSPPVVGSNGNPEKKPLAPRGAPPPVPPNKPILPSKKEPVFKRMEPNLPNSDIVKKKDSSEPIETPEVPRLQTLHCETYSNVNSMTE